MTHASAEDLYAVIRHVRPLFRHLYAAVEQALRDLGYSVPERGVLERLHDGGPQTVPQIARTLLVQRQFVQRVVNDLLIRGLVERRTNPASRKSWLIALTPAGEEAFAEIRRRENAVSAPIAAALPAAEVATCERVLAHMTLEFGRLVQSGAASDEGDTT